MTKICSAILFSLFFTPSIYAFESTIGPYPAMMGHVEALAGESGIGPRVAGSQEEVQAAHYILQAFKEAGISAEIQPFSAVFRGQSEAQDSQNVLATLPGKSTNVFVIGAHYDSVPAATGSMGVIDNAASIALMLELARYAKAQQTLPFSLIFVAFGAEEVGLNGAKYYVNQMSPDIRANVVGMLNLDSITGGDNLYIHSAHSAGFPCDGDKSEFVATPVWRDRLLALADTKNLSFEKHTGNEAYPSGETGGWSDHAPFACAGIPIAYIEATNFELVGEDGKDGYSQTDNPALWNCFDPDTMGTCDKANEKRWGKIWHTHFDTLDVLDKEFPQRLEFQLNQSYLLLTAFIDSLGSVAEE